MEDAALFFGVLGAFVAFLDEHGAESWKEAETMASSGCRVHAGPHRVSGCYQGCGKRMRASDRPRHAIEQAGQALAG